jgi:hypothetical protein
MRTLRTKATDEQIFAHALASEKAFVALMELWETGMKARNITSKEYKEICKAGKQVQTINYLLKEDIIKRYGSKKADELFVKNINCGFS